MAQFSYNNVIKFRNLDESPEPPFQLGSESLRETVVKDILTKRLNTKFGIDQYLISKNKFEPSSEHRGATFFTSGLKSTNSFKEIIDDINLKESLLPSHIDQREIASIRKESSTSSSPVKLNAPERKLNLRQYEKCRKTSERADYLSSSAPYKSTSIQSHTEKILHPDHPMNRICEIEKEIFPNNTSKEILNFSNKVANNSLKDVENSSTQSPAMMKNQADNVQYFATKPNSFWDLDKIPIVKDTKILNISPDNVRGCKRKPLSDPLIVAKRNPPSVSMNFSEPFVWRLDESQLVSRLELMQNRMNVENLGKEDKRFHNYEVGSPSNIIFVKNLPRKCEPLSIVRIFSLFKKATGPKIEYRILRGRMKGQAFIKFPDIETSKSAIDLCNGYVIDGKPIVLQFGKKVSVL